MRRRRAKPVVRALRHRKRAPQLTGPITLTVVTTRNAPPTTTISPVITLSPSPVPPPPSLPPPPPPTVLPPAPSITSLGPLPPTPQISVVPRPSSSGPRTSSTSASENTFNGTRALPAGAIVGIVIGAVLVLLAILVLLLRSSFRKSRKTKRSTWLAKGGISAASFAAIQRASTVPGDTRTIPRTSYVTTEKVMAEKVPVATGETSPGIAFASAQAHALARVPVPVPTPPPTLPLPPPPRPAPNPSPMMVSPVTASLAPGAAIVKFTFIPSLPDELTISQGEIIQILQEFDDGWALCANARDVQGMVPLECLERQQEELVTGKVVRSGLGVPGERTDRRSSLNAASIIQRYQY